MPNLEDMRELLWAKCFWKLDLLQGYRQMPLAPEAPGVFTIVTPDGLFTTTRVPQGVLNAASHFQSVMSDLLRGLDCSVWVNDVFSFVEDEISLLCLLMKFLAGWRVLVSSSLLTCALFSLANWFGVHFFFRWCRVESFRPYPRF